MPFKDPFEDINRQLGGIVSQRMDPRNQLIQLKTKQFADELVRDRLVSDFISTAQIDVNNPESLANFLKDLSVFDERFIPAFVNASAASTKFTERQKQQRKLTTFAEDIEGAGLPGTGKALAAGAPPGLISNIFSFETKEEKEAENVPAGFAQVFTGGSINSFISSGRIGAKRDFSLLKFRPEYLQRISKGSGEGKPPLGVALTKEQRQLAVGGGGEKGSIKLKLEAHPFFKGGKGKSGQTFEGVGDRGFFDVTGKDLDELGEGAIKNDDEIVKLLQGAPDDFKALFADYVKIKFGTDVIDKLFTREQLQVPSQQFLPQTQQQQVQQDEFGFTVGEQRPTQDGRTAKYIGNNQWQIVQ